MNTARSRAALALAALIIPAVWVFVNSGKSFHVDDALFLIWAREISPLAGEARTGEINWQGFREPLVNQTRHYPPGWALTLAGARHAVGYSESALHWLQWPFAAMFLWGCVLLAKRFAAPAWPVLAMCATSPLFLLPSASLMPDLACLGPGVLGLALMLSSRSLAGTVLAGLLIVLSAQAKQTILPLLPLLFLDSTCRFHRDPKRLAVAGVAVLLCGVYPNAGPGSETGSIASHVIWILDWAWNPRLLLPKLGYAVAVLSALAVFPAAFFVLVLSKARNAPDFARVKALALGFAVFIALSALGFWKGKALLAASSVPPVAAGANALWFDVCIIFFIAWAALTFKGALRDERRWLVLWVLLVAGGNVLGTPFPAARFHAFVLPALAILVLGDIGHRMGVAAGKAVIAAAVIGNVWLSAGLASSDYAFARFSREAAGAGAKEAAALGVPLVTTGHWGLQFYAERAGGSVLDRTRDRLEEGALALEPEIADGKAFPRRLAGREESRRVLSGSAGFPAALISPARTLPPRSFSASFHGGHVWFPYAFTLAPLERIAAIRVAPARGRRSRL